ncbi:MAG: acetyl-coenzyme A synthetase N-terminal domain-containing protein, partial [Thiolinea sp.]
MSEAKTYPIPAGFAEQANINAEQYAAMYQRSIDDPDGFWAEQAEEYLTWSKKWDKVSDWSFDKDDVHIRWFEGGEINVTENCLDRHLATRGDQVA